VSLAAVVEVGLAGSVGAVARLVTDGWVRTRWSRPLPAGTLVINLAGSLLLGLLVGLVEFHHVTTTLTLVAGTGFCGGFTTFSTASFETVRLAQEGERGVAALYLGATVAGTVLGAAAGIGLMSL
jgi:CrcB protein